MKSKFDFETQKILLLIKIDSERLFERIKYRKPEYLNTFALKRTREHFSQIFKNRYENVGIDLLAFCSKETLVAIDNFYSKADDLHWYLNHTEDMPNTVEDNLNFYIKDLERLINTLKLYLNADLGYEKSSSIEEFVLSDNIETDALSDEEFEFDSFTSSDQSDIETDNFEPEDIDEQEK